MGSRRIHNGQRQGGQVLIILSHLSLLQGNVNKAETQGPD